MSRSLERSNTTNGSSFYDAKRQTKALHNQKKTSTNKSRKNPKKAVFVIPNSAPTSGVDVCDESDVENACQSTLSHASSIFPSSASMVSLDPADESEDTCESSITTSPLHPRTESTSSKKSDTSSMYSTMSSCISTSNSNASTSITRSSQKTSSRSTSFSDNTSEKPKSTHSNSSSSHGSSGKMNSSGGSQSPAPSTVSSPTAFEKVKTKDSIFYFDYSHVTILSLNSKCITDIVLPFHGKSESFMPHIQVLNLDGNKLSTLPENISCLTSLQSVSAHNNTLFCLPKNVFQNLTNITYIGLHNNKLGCLPESISSCIQLIRLDSKINKITEAPRNLSNLIKLQKINLDDNLISDFPVEYLVLPSLTYLSLNKNHIQLCSWANMSAYHLQILSLCENNIDHVPPSVFFITSLRALFLKANKLVSLPPSISKCTNMDKINIARNALCELPHEIGSLTNLKSLCIEENNLRALPSSFSNLSGLTELSISGNPLEVPPLALCLLGPEPIRSFFKSNSPDNLCGFLEAQPLSHKSEIKFSDIDEVKHFKPSQFAELLIGKWKGRDVIVKNIAQEHASQELTEKFANELHIFRILQRKEESNILVFFGACIEPPIFGIVMEYMPNGSLYDYLRNKRNILSKESLLNIAFDVSKGIQQLHHHPHGPIIHCDLKTPNCLVDSLGRVKVADFGMSRIAGKTQSNAEQIRYLSCVPMYAAPEVLASHTFSEKSDIFSLGIVLWEIFTCKDPFGSHESDPCQLIIQGHRPPIPKTIEKWYKKLIGKCWDAEPCKRPTIQDVVHEFRTKVKR